VLVYNVEYVVMTVKPANAGQGSGSGRRRGRPALISRDQILTVALRIVDERGLQRLTMRRLGTELGVDPMAVYHYIADKAALFDGIVERVYSEVILPARTGHWDQDLRAIVRAVRRTFLAHGETVALLGTRPPITQPAFDLVETITAILLDAGFTEQDAADGFDCAGRLVIGHTLTEAARPPGGEVSGGEDDPVQTQQTLPPDRYPSLALVRQAGIHHDPERLFEFALDGLVLSLQTRLFR
jgi:TetR/AcrR family tetracycline transcriptional repressor